MVSLGCKDFIQRVLLLFKSPPAMNVFRKGWKNFWNWYAFRLCFGGLYTAVIVMSFKTNTVVGPLPSSEIQWQDNCH